LRCIAKYSQEASFIHTYTVFWTSNKTKHFISS